MNISNTETLETARAIHSFLEHWAIGFFVGVVACDVILRFMEDRVGWTGKVHWQARRLRIAVRGFGVTLPWPAYDGVVSIKSLLKTHSLLWFAVAIVLEAVALPYSEAVDELADGELAASQRQIVAALVKAGDANREAEIARRDAAEAHRGLALAEQHSTEANAKAEGFRLEPISQMVRGRFSSSSRPRAFAAIKHFA